MTSYLTFSQLILYVDFKMLSEKNECRKFYDFAGAFHVKAGKAMKKPVISGLHPEV